MTKRVWTLCRTGDIQVHLLHSSRSALGAIAQRSREGFRRFFAELLPVANCETPQLTEAKPYRDIRYSRFLPGGHKGFMRALEADVRACVRHARRRTPRSPGRGRYAKGWWRGTRSLAGVDVLGRLGGTAAEQELFHFLDEELARLRFDR